MVVALGLPGCEGAETPRLSHINRPRPCPAHSRSGDGRQPAGFAMPQAAARLMPIVSNPAPISSVPPVRLTTFWTEGLRMVFRAAEARSA